MSSNTCMTRFKVVVYGMKTKSKSKLKLIGGILLSLAVSGVAIYLISKARKNAKK